jgi:guanine deaminase
MKTNLFMARAIELAIRNARSGRGGPFGAVIVRKNKIISEATNRVTLTNDPTAHAEILAIRSACRQIKRFELSDCEIYASCEPCPMCLGAIYWSRLKTIYFAGTSADASEAGFDDSQIYREFRRPAGNRRIPMKQLMQEEAREAFRAWRKLKNKIPY